LRRRLRRAWEELGGVAPLAAIGLLLFNDHYGKRAFHNALTGKLSDVAICFLLPLLLAAGFRLVGWVNVRARVLVAAFVSGVLFTALELSDTTGAVFVQIMAKLGRRATLTRDLTDLAALVFVPLAAAYALWRARRLSATGTSRVRRLSGVAAAALGSLALMADEPGPRCDQWTPPVVLQAEPGCGKGGLVVIEAGRWSGDLTFYNAAALGLPPVAAYKAGTYHGAACPFLLEEGDWDVTLGTCSTSTNVGPSPLDADVLGVEDAGLDAAMDPGADAASAASVDGGGSPDTSAPDGGTAIVTCTADARVCTAAREGTELWFTCRARPTSAVLCRSRLTVIP